MLIWHPALVFMAVRKRKRTVQKKLIKKKAPKNTGSKSKIFTASVYTNLKDGHLPLKLVKVIQALEKSLKKKVFMVIQNGKSPYGQLDETLIQRLRKEVDNIPRELALLIDSPGGYAIDAYRLSALLRKASPKYLALVSRYAKSAATLVVLGAGQIMLGSFGELGPLDAWYYDPEKEEKVSALNEVQALERLHAFSLEAIDSTMILLGKRANKKISTLLPLSLDYICGLLKPIFEKIDVVHYTRSSRVLLAAEEYATRLLSGRYSKKRAAVIARHLTEMYPEHGFSIDIEEAKRIDANLVVAPSEEQDAIMKKIVEYLESDITIIGTIEEAK